MKTKALYMLILAGFLASCCDRADRYFTISSDNMLLYNNGQQLKFKDSAGVVDTFIVDILKYQAQEAVVEHYYHEKYVEAVAYCENMVCRFRNLHDTAITQSITTGYVQSSNHSFSYLRRVTINDCEPYETGTLRYGYNESFQLNQIELKNGVLVDGVSYDGVYFIDSDSIDIWFSNKYGLLRYELPDGNWKEKIGE